MRTPKIARSQLREKAVPAKKGDSQQQVSSEQGNRLRILQRKSISDRDYTLLERFCPNCKLWHYEISRFSGASFSRYFMSENFVPDDFDNFVGNLDETLLENAADLIQDYHRQLTAKNSETGIEADGSFAFRLLEYGRHRISRLSKLGRLDAIISKEPPHNPEDEAVRVAFELGMATAEHRLLDMYEDYLFDGMAMSEWREAGLPKARAERLRLGKATRLAIVRAARQLYKAEPVLVRNDSETARRIVALNLRELQKGSGLSLGVDAITRHLRAARHSNDL